MSNHKKSAMNLNQVTIPSQDLEISVPFYQSHGLILIVDNQLKSIQSQRAQEQEKKLEAIEKI